ncbi:hypothetical protein C8J57DRAFT_1523784 [Mycena rebaudengoi]|nr:hypothetical protein C8J57DRAFT_1523784 [Mycena rebaudengoi]
MPKEMPSMGRQATRKANKHAHPAFDTGYAKRPQKRRTSDKVAEDEAKEKSAQVTAAKAQRSANKNLATIEDDMRNTDIQREAEANHPVDAQVPRVPAAKAQRDVEEKDEGDGEASLAIISCIVLTALPDPEYVENSDPGSDGEDDEGDDEDVPKKSRGRSKVVKTSRADITAERKTEAVKGTPEVTGDKRKGSPKAKGDKKKKKSGKKAGLAKRTVSSASGKSSQLAVDDDDDDHMVRLGGPALDDDPNERIELQEKKKKRGKPSEATPAKLLTLKTLRKGRKKWTPEDLPTGTARQFKDDVVPLARDLLGLQHNPWEPLSDDQVQGILDLVYGPKKHTTEDPAWQGLLAYRMSDWRAGIATQALKGMQGMVEAAQEGDYHSDDEAPDSEEEDDSLDLKTTEGIKAFVAWALQVKEHTSPFHWKQWGDGVLKEGLFEGELIVYAFAAHLTAISCIPPKYSTHPNPPPPIGALILSIQAAERALRAWSTGTQVLSNKGSDHFSKDNWGDTTKERNGKQVKDRRATKYVDTIRTFKDAQWAAIHHTASQWVEKKRTGSSRSSSMDVDMPGIVSDEDDHFVLKADTSESGAAAAPGSEPPAA